MFLCVAAIPFNLLAKSAELKFDDESESDRDQVKETATVTAPKMFVAKDDEDTDSWNSDVRSMAENTGRIVLKRHCAVNMLRSQITVGCMNIFSVETISSRIHLIQFVNLYRKNNITQTGKLLPAKLPASLIFFCRKSKLRKNYQK